MLSLRPHTFDRKRNAATRVTRSCGAVRPMTFYAPSVALCGAVGSGSAALRSIGTVTLWAAFSLVSTNRRRVRVPWPPDARAIGRGRGARAAALSVRGGASIRTLIGPRLGSVPPRRKAFGGGRSIWAVRCRCASASEQGDCLSSGRLIRRSSFPVQLNAEHGQRWDSARNVLPRALFACHCRQRAG